MEQGEFKVSFSVGKKLILSTVLLLAAVVGFLNISTILLFKNDKIAYVFDSQLSQSVLIGRELVQSCRQVFDTLRVVMSASDFSKELTDTEKSRIKDILLNQNTIVAARLYWGDLKGDTPFTHTTLQAALAEKSGIIETDPIIPFSELKKNFQELEKQKYSFFNLSKLGGTQLLGVAFMDTNSKTNQNVVGIAILNLGEFGKGLEKTKISFSDRIGNLLYDNDPGAVFKSPSISKNPLFQTAEKLTVTSGTTEFEDKGQSYLGSFVKPGLGLVVLNYVDRSKVMKATYELTEKFILLAVFAIGIAVVLTLFFSKTITKPLNVLYEATKKVAKGDFSISLQSKKSDEIGALTNAFTLMSSQINDLIGEKLKKLQLENEIAVAGTVQKTLIPGPHLKNEFVQIESHYESASKCGGDWWGHFKHGSKLVLMIADATGHGIPAALVTAAARSCSSILNKVMTENGGLSMSPGNILSYANRVVYEVSYGQIMMTFFCCEIDFDKMELTYASAGHNPQWLYQFKDGVFTMKSLIGQGNRCGEEFETPPYKEEKVAISESDILFLYTDGLVEGKNLKGDQYGKKKTLKVIKESLKDGPRPVIDSLMKDFYVHNSGKEFDDDVTLVSVLIKPPVTNA